MCEDWRIALRMVDQAAASALGPEMTGLVNPAVYVGEDAAREWLGRQYPGPNVLLVPGSSQAGWVLPLLRCKDGLTVLWLDRDTDRFTKALDAIACQEPVALADAITKKRLVLDPGGRSDASTDRFLGAADFSRRPVIRILDAELVDAADMQMLGEMTREARELIRYETCDLSTRMHFGASWQDQTVRNLPAITRQAPVKGLFGVFKGIPALVVAAGPSLADVIPYIAQHRHRMVVLCVGRVLSHLVYRAGVMPDLAITGDGQQYVVKHFVDKPRMVPVVASSFTEPALVETLDRVFFMEVESMNLPKWIRSKVGELGEVFPGGNVSTAAMAIAEAMGCNPILTAGLDLSYPDDGKTHIAGKTQAQREDDPDYTAPQIYRVPGKLSG
jgi:hypothetical protein